MKAPHLPPEPTILPKRAPGWFALAMLIASVLSFAALVSGVLPGEDRPTSFFTLWEERMITVWLAAGLAGVGLGIVALISGDWSVTTLLIVLLGIPASVILLVA